MRRYISAEKNWSAIALFLLITILSFCNTACSSSSEEEISLYQRGLDLIQELDYIAEKEDVIKMMIQEPSTVEEIKKIGKEDYSQPKAVYKIENIIDDKITIFENETNVKLSQETKDILLDRIIANLPLIINKNNGTTSVIVSSILTRSNSFKHDMKEHVSIYLYTMDHSSHAFIVSFQNQTHGVVTATAGIINNQEFTAFDQKNYEDYFHTIGFQNVKLSEITH